MIENLGQWVRRPSEYCLAAALTGVLLFWCEPGGAQTMSCIDAAGVRFSAVSDPQLPMAGVMCESGRVPESRNVSYGTEHVVAPAVVLRARQPDMPVAGRTEPPFVGSHARGASGSAFDSLIESAARRWGHDPALIHAVIQVESSYAAEAVSPKGAVGLMQIMPDTARRYGVGNANSVLRDPAVNIDLGARHLSNMKRLFGGDIRLALAGYNAGEQAVLNSGRRVPPFAETQSYVREVLDRYVELSRCGRGKTCR